MMFLLDANVIITAKDSYYALNQVPEFWDWLLHQGTNGHLKVPREIFEEVSPGRNKDDPFYAWRKDKATLTALVLEEDINPTILQKVIHAGYGADLTDDELETIGRDPFLVAYALSGHGRCVVTTEVSRPGKKRQNRKLPDVCDQFGVDWIDTFRMTRALKFSTKWKG